MNKETLKLWGLYLILTLCSATFFSACSDNDDSEKDNVSVIADKVWTYSQSHPDGFTIDIHTMTEPTEGIAVSYAATQNGQSAVYVLSTGTEIPVN